MHKGDQYQRTEEGTIKQPTEAKERSTAEGRQRGYQILDNGRDPYHKGARGE